MSVHPLWLIPAFIAGAVVGFFAAYWIATAMEKVLKEIREGFRLE